MAVKFKDLPKRGTMVRMIWQDSGMYNDGPIHPSEMSIGKDEFFGRVVRKSQKHQELTIAMRKPPQTHKLDKKNDFYFTAKVVNIVKLYILEAVKEIG